VTGGTDGLFLVHLDHFAVGSGSFGGGAEFWDIGRWRSGFVMEEFFHDEGTSNDGRGAFSVGTCGEEGGLGHEPASGGFFGERVFLKAVL